MADEQRRARLLQELTELLTDAAGDGKQAERDEVIGAGVKPELAASIVRESATISTPEEARAAAEAWTSYVADRLEDLAAKVADGSIVDRVPPL